MTSPLVGMWDDQTRYRVIDPESGRSEVVTILGTDDEMKDPMFLEEIEHYARESVLKGWNKVREKPHMNEAQVKELPHILREIKASHRYWAENLHTRWW